MNPCDVLDCRQLRIFLTVWELRNITRAAGRLNLSQPTVSSHLRALEDQLGTTLFHRTPSGLEPTGAAKVLHPYARRIIRLSRTAMDELSAFKGQDSGHLDVGASNIPGQYLLPTLLAAFKQQRPAVDISLRISDTAAVTGQVDAGEVEVGIVGARINSGRIHFHECFDDELVYVVDRNSRLSRLASASIGQIMEHPIVIREKGSGSRLTVETELEKMGMELAQAQIVMELGSTEAVRQAVKAGIGGAFISRRAVMDDLACGLLHCVKVEGLSIRRRFYVIYSKSRSLSPVARSFVELIMDEARSERAGETG